MYQIRGKLARVRVCAIFCQVMKKGRAPVGIHTVTRHSRITRAPVGEYGGRDSNPPQEPQGVLLARMCLSLLTGYTPASRMCARSCTPCAVNILLSCAPSNARCQRCAYGCTQCLLRPHPIKKGAYILYQFANVAQDRRISCHFCTTSLFRT
jgi:hypothetical protein